MKKCLRSQNAQLAAGDHVNRTLGEVSADRVGSQGAVTPDKAVIEVGEPQEVLQLHPESRPRPIHHRSQLPGIHLHTPCSNDETQKRDGGTMELAMELPAGSSTGIGEPVGRGTHVLRWNRKI